MLLIQALNSLIQVHLLLIALFDPSAPSTCLSECILNLLIQAHLLQSALAASGLEEEENTFERSSLNLLITALFKTGKLDEVEPLVHPSPYTLYPTPYTLHPTPDTLHPTP